MYQSIVKQKGKQPQMDESSHHFLSGGKESIILESTNNEKSTSAMKQNKIKPRDLSSPYSTSFNSNSFNKKKIQSQSVEKYNQQKLNKNNNNVKQPWKKSEKNTTKNQSQEDDNKELQTTAVSDLRGSQNNLQSKYEKDQKRNTNSPTGIYSQQQISNNSQSKSNYQSQLGSSTEYNIHNISTTTTATAASRGNSRLAQNKSYKKNNQPQTNNIQSSRSPKYYQFTNPNSSSINPWNLNNQKKQQNFNTSQQEDTQNDEQNDKKYQSTQEYSPDNNKKLSGSNRVIGGVQSKPMQKQISSPTEPQSGQKKNRNIQSANLDSSNGKIVKGLQKQKTPQQNIIDRTNSQNITTIKKNAGQSNQKQVIDNNNQKRDSETIKQKKPSIHNYSASNRNKTTTSTQNQQKQQKVQTNVNQKEAFNKKLNSKIQQKTFERSTNDINSASDTEYFEMSQKFSTIGDPRLFMEHYMGGSATSSNPSPFLKPQNHNITNNNNIKNNIPLPKKGLKYPNYKIDQQSNSCSSSAKKNQEQYSFGYRQCPEDEIEEKIETESKNSVTNSPCQTKRKYENNNSQEIEINQINQLDYNLCENDQQNRITQDFKNDYTMSHIPELQPLTMSKLMQKDNQEGHDGDDEDNSGDYTDYEKQKKINSTGLSFTKPNLIIKRNESYVSDLQKTQDKIFQKYSNPSHQQQQQHNQTHNYNNHNHYGSQNHNFSTQQYDEQENEYNNHQNNNYQIDEQDEFNQTQTRFFKEQMSNMMTATLRPYTPPFQSVCPLNSSNLRKQESICSNHSISSQIHHQNESELNHQNKQHKQRNSINNNNNINNQHTSSQSKYDFQNKSSISSHKAEQELELMYDDILNCYYDPKTNQYYELKA